jgi:hypothetical protein
MEKESQSRRNSLGKGERRVRVSLKALDIEERDRTWYIYKESERG